jgi:hypothetical protein
MSRRDDRLECVLDQIRQEKESRELLDSNPYMCEGRKEQIIEKRKAQIRRQYGYSMDKNMRI